MRLRLQLAQPHARGARRFERDVATHVGERNNRDAAIVGLGARDQVLGGAHARIPAGGRAPAVIDQQRERRGSLRSRERRIPQRSGGSDDQIAGIEALSVIPEELLLIELTHRLFSATDGQTQRMPLPEVLREQLMHEVIRIVLVHLDLFEDDAALFLDVLFSEERVEHQVSEDVHRGRQVRVEALHVEADGLFGGEGVHVATNRIHLPGNLLGRAMLGSFENHVLNEMRNAVPLQVFIARPGLDPDTNGDRPDMLHLLGQNNQTVGENFAMDIALLFNHISCQPIAGRSSFPKYCYTPRRHARMGD